jgi:hypothetical protein
LWRIFDGSADAIIDPKAVATRIFLAAWFAATALREALASK